MMITTKLENQTLSELYTYGHMGEIKERLSKLQKQRMKLDQFMSMFLEKFERQMKYEELDTPVWDLYRKKNKEYTEVCSQIKKATYYLNK